MVVEQLSTAAQWVKENQNKIEPLTILVTEKLTSPVRTGLLHSPVSPHVTMHHTAHYPPVATVLKMCKSELSGKVQFPACACSVTAALLDHPNTGAIIAAAPTPTPNLSFHNCTLDNAKFDNCTSLQTAHSSHHIWW